MDDNTKILIEIREDISGIKKDVSYLICSLNRHEKTIEKTQDELDQVNTVLAEHIAKVKGAGIFFGLICTVLGVLFSYQMK